MSTSSIQQSTQKKMFPYARLHSFLETVHFSQMLRQSNAYRSLGIPLVKLVNWLLLMALSASDPESCRGATRIYQENGPQFSDLDRGSRS